MRPTAAAVQALYALSDGFWSGGAIFFGLWLIAMGHAVLVSRWMPRALGYLLIAGGVGYVASAFVKVLLPDANALFQALSVPATIGEFWILGYLIVLGVRMPRASAAPAPGMPKARALAIGAPERAEAATTWVAVGRGRREAQRPSR